MTAFQLIVRVPAGGLLVGGAAAALHGIHAVHATLADGRAYVPATALRGALRESLEAMLRGSRQHHACAGGDGIDPDTRTAADDPAAANACALGAGDTACVACRLFGTRRGSVGGDRAFSGLVLGDALLQGEATWSTRPSVAIGRATRSAADQHLRFARMPQATSEAPLAFTATGRLTDRALQSYLEASVRATTHLGSGRSRGLGRVELSIDWRPAAPAGSPRGASIDDVILVRATLLSPALVGASVIDSNYRETRQEIPGAALRGAVGFALRELVEDAHQDPPTQALLDEVHGARFGFLYPVDATPPPGVAAVPGTLPITAEACKYEGRAHGAVDTLLDRLALQAAASGAEADRVIQRSVSQCPQCTAPLRSVYGSRRAVKPANTRTITRASMDRTRRSAQDGQLFTQVLLAPGVALEGTIRNIPAIGKSRLVEALTSGIVSFGRGRSAGWGQVRIEIATAPVLLPVGRRAAAFDHALRARLNAAGLGSDHVGRLVAVSLLTPLWPSGSDDVDDGERELRLALDAQRCLLAARRFSRDGSWNQRTGEMTAFRATAAGGVFVFELAAATWRDIVPRLEAIERDGVGRRRDQGYGQVLCFDPQCFMAQKG